ncbi:MAG TPA: hypothetical protein VG964_00680 [Candidatus Saccharimonadales bacterium]|nr:hypothetical protein [Candidatus Saccharimonadales bacterium]
MRRVVILAWGMTVDKLRKSLEQTLELIAVSTKGLLVISQKTTLVQILAPAFPQLNFSFAHEFMFVFKGWSGHFYSFSPNLNKEAR